MYVLIELLIRITKYQCWFSWVLQLNFMLMCQLNDSRALAGFPLKVVTFH